MSVHELLLFRLKDQSHIGHVYPSLKKLVIITYSVLFLTAFDSIELLLSENQLTIVDEEVYGPLMPYIDYIFLDGRKSNFCT